ncbi:MAG: hypothetical protein FD173_2093 [Gallionellaceae bacterium]|nr:MAG: hypothetical protein FD173_2093 [Gallionellaceae bacterium]
MKISSHPLWLVGFRPFFTLAILAGMSLPLLWALIYSGAISAPTHSFSSVQWHAHEMFFGFGWAVIGGFLLTATKNWVKVRGYHGYALIFLASAWLFERAGMWLEGTWPPLLFYISNNLFLIAIVSMVMWTLIKNRKADFYRDNYFFLLILPAFLLTKNLLLSADYFQTGMGMGMAVGLFRVAILVMLERTLFDFMKGAFQVEILLNPRLNTTIKLLAIPLVFIGLLPVQLAAVISLLLATLLLGRLFYWKPQLGMRRLDIGIMYLGYLAIIAQLLIDFSRLTGLSTLTAALSIHVFTFGAMGLIIPAMLIRISKGHTGRKVVFDALDKLALYFMMLAFVMRIIAPQLYPSSYTVWIALAASCWFACFAILGWRYIPILMQPRVDGREH